MSLALRRRAMGKSEVVLALDEFERANSPSLGNADIGGAWTLLQGTWNIAEGNARNSEGADGDSVVLAVGQADQKITSEIAVIAGTANWGAIGRVANVSNYYLCNFAVGGGAPGLSIYKRVAGGYTQLATVALTPAAGDVVKFDVVGTSVKAIVNGVERLSVTDASLTAGNNAGMRYGGSGPSPEWENFKVTAP